MFVFYLWSCLLFEMEYLFSCLVLTNLSCTVFGNLSLFNTVEFFQAANYLNIKSLLDLTCQTVADMIKGKTPEEIRKTFNIKNDFTPEEEEEVRRENQWAFEWVLVDYMWSWTRVFMMYYVALYYISYSYSLTLSFSVLSTLLLEIVSTLKCK